MRVLAISGSLRHGSHNSALLRAAAELAPDGVEVELWDGLKAIPPYDEDDDPAARRTGGPAPAAVTALRSAVAGADAVLIATPEYNHSIPGALKNAIDWVSRPIATNPLRNKPVAVIGASTGVFGAVWAQAELRKVLGALGARVLDRELAVGQAAQRVGERPIDDRELLVELGDVVAELVGAVERRRAASAAVGRVAATATLASGEPALRATA